MKTIERLKASVEELPPAYFALVMATGIVSIASHLMGFQAVAEILFRLNIIFFICLLLLTMGRIIFFPYRFFSDMEDHGRAVGYLTIVAATGIGGSQLIILGKNVGAAVILFAFSFILWLILIYAIFTLLAVRSKKPTLRSGINGIWLISVVSTQSVSALSSMLVYHLPDYRQLMMFFSLLTFLMGSVLYIIIITLIFYRIMFFRLPLEELRLTYWINMGAAAATTLAGTMIAANSHGSVLLERIFPFTIGFTLFFWAIATWWIPLLLLLDIWRFFTRRGFSPYDPEEWGMVFPIGMYTVCTFQLSNIPGMELVLYIPDITIYAALAAWTLACIGLLRSIKKLFVP